MTGRLLQRVIVGVLAATGVACAHAPASNESKVLQASAKGPAKAAQPERVVVTGSHIPQRVDVASGLPATTAPVRIYSRSQIDDTGRQFDLRAALQQLDPSVQ